MAETRKDKFISLMTRLAGEFLEEEVGLPGVIVTITRVEMSGDLQNAKIFFSVFPEEKEVPILNQVRKIGGNFREFLKSRIKSKFLPRAEFILDEQMKEQRRVEEILKNIG